MPPEAILAQNPISPTCKSHVGGKEHVIPPSERKPNPPLSMCVSKHYQYSTVIRIVEKCIDEEEANDGNDKK